MDFTALVDVAIGLIFLYLGTSLFVTIANEFLGQMLGLRAKQLKANLKELLDHNSSKGADTVLDRLQTNPALASFFAKRKFLERETAATYVDPNLLARQIVGGVRKGARGMNSMKELLESIDEMEDGKLKKQLQALSQTVEGGLDDFVDAVSDWVDQSLTMMGEVYKRNMRIIGLLVGLVTAFGLNIDTVSITSRLYQDKEARMAIATLASDFVSETSRETWDRCLKLSPNEQEKDADCTSIRSLMKGVELRNENLGVLPLGWPNGFLKTDYPSALIGWLLTALATSLGATFWFDILSKLVNIRHGIRKPAVQHGTESKKQSKKP